MKRKLGIGLPVIALLLAGSYQFGIHHVAAMDYQVYSAGLTSHMRSRQAYLAIRPRRSDGARLINAFTVADDRLTFGGTSTAILGPVWYSHNRTEAHFTLDLFLCGGNGYIIQLDLRQDGQGWHMVHETLVQEVYC